MLSVITAFSTCKKDFEIEDIFVSGIIEEKNLLKFVFETDKKREINL